MSGRRRLEQRLQIAVGPLPKRAFARDFAARVERLAQIDDESFPLVVRELSIEIYGQSNADRESKERAGRRRGAS